MGLIRGILTLALTGAFLGLVVWLYFFRRSQDFDEAARIPLQQSDKDTDIEKGAEHE